MSARGSFLRSAMLLFGGFAFCQEPKQDSQGKIESVNSGPGVQLNLYGSGNLDYRPSTTINLQISVNAFGVNGMPVSLEQIKGGVRVARAIFKWILPDGKEVKSEVDFQALSRRYPLGFAIVYSDGRDAEVRFPSFGEYTIDPKGLSITENSEGFSLRIAKVTFGKGGTIADLQLHGAWGQKAMPIMTDGVGLHVEPQPVLPPGSKRILVLGFKNEDDLKWKIRIQAYRDADPSIQKQMEVQFPGLKERAEGRHAISPKQQ